MRLSALIASSLVAGSFAHMEMQYPAPRRSKFNPSEPAPDYNMVAPLAADGSGLICKHYTPGAPVATFRAGDTIPVRLAGTTFHNGGHCEVSLSYDDQTFVVLRQDLVKCLTGTGLDLPATIPATAPAAERATLAWTWVNASGNRELYMNCADVRILPNLSVPADAAQLVGRNVTYANQPGYPLIAEAVGGAPLSGTEIYASAPLVKVDAAGKTVVVPQASIDAAPSPAASALPPASPSPAASSSPAAPAASSSPVAPSTIPPVPSPSASASKAPVAPSPSASSSKAPVAPSPSKAPLAASPSKSKLPASASASRKPAASKSPAAPASSSVACATQCSGVSSYTVCSNGITYQMKCAAGTVCTSNAGFIFCDWPSVSA